MTPQPSLRRFAICLAILAYYTVFCNTPISMQLRGTESGSDDKLPFKPLYDPQDTDPWKKDLFQRLDRIRLKCGELCTINDKTTLDNHTVYQEGPGRSFQQLEVDVDCDAILLDEDIDIGDTSVPYPPPEELMPYYTMNGLIEFKLFKKFGQVYLGSTQKKAKEPWSEEFMAPFVHNALVPPGGVVHGGYGRETTLFRDAVKKYVPINGKRVLVIGTENPWAEGIALALGAAHVTTLEYGSVVTDHPRMTALTPAKFRELYKSGSLGKFDVVFSFSSLEHPGLGRYGDSLNPWGDILALARARCVTKPGGYLALGLPSASQGKGRDRIEFNAHRIYGKYRFPLMTANWKQVDGNEKRTTTLQPTFIFQNPI